MHRWVSFGSFPLSQHSLWVVLRLQQSRLSVFESAGAGVNICLNSGRAEIMNHWLRPELLGPAQMNDLASLPTSLSLVPSFSLSTSLFLSLPIPQSFSPCKGAGEIFELSMVPLCLINTETLQCSIQQGNLSSHFMREHSDCKGYLFLLSVSMKRQKEMHSV